VSLLPLPPLRPPEANLPSFDATNDDIKAFPTGLQIVSGNPNLRTAPSTSGAAQLDPSKGPVQPAQITCPRSNFSPASWPAGSDGSMAGIKDPFNDGAGIGFPFQDCDGYASPMRVDVHFPSCYDPSAGLTNQENNMQFPKDVGSGKLDCPEGWIHVPHMFFETYWDTHAFAPRFQSMVGKASPFVFSNGDTTGFSAHADFIAGWDEEELQHIIDTCDAGHAGIHTCPGLKNGVNDAGDSCNIECPLPEVINGKLEKLPGNNPLAGWGAGGGDVVHVPAASDSGSDADSKPSSSSSEAPPTTTLLPVPVTTLQSSNNAAVDEPTTSQGPPPPVKTTSKTHKVHTVYDTVTVYQTKTVYANPAPTDAAQQLSEKSSEDIAGFQPVGCFRDSRNRALSGEKLPKIGDASNTACVTYCASKGFSVAGTEFGGECFCGNGLSPLEKLDDGECSMACKGDAAQTCGGNWALSVYAKGGQLAAAASRRQARSHLHNHVRSPSRRYRK
jgi:hypothetical protein